MYFLSGLSGMFVKALSRTKNNTDQIKPAKAGIRKVSSERYPISNNEQKNVAKLNTAQSATIGFIQYSFEEIEISVLSIVVKLSFLRLW